MRILIISFYFPPFNTIGAVRVGKIAKYLFKFGHEIKVITAREQPLPKTLSLEIPEENVIYTPWIDINKPVEIIWGGKDKIAEEGYSISPSSSIISNLIKSVRVFYKTLLNFPDWQIGWYPAAYRGASEIIRNWKPDLIYASARPWTSLIVASSLSKKYKIPWVAELRDLWTDNPYYEDEYIKLRRIIETELEHKILSSACALVTVSEPLAETLKHKYNKPVEVILNGFDPGDIPDYRGNSSIGDNTLRIVYTGMIYEGKRDPTPLFMALNKLGPVSQNIRVVFYGKKLDIVKKIAVQHKVEHLVEVYKSIPYKEALKEQREADILLLLLWNDPRERGVYTGKLFEYIGARRPILAIGPADNVAAELILNRNSGIVSNDPDKIASWLYDLIQIKSQNGVILDLPESVTTGLTREEQVKRLEDFILKLERKGYPGNSGSD